MPIVGNGDIAKVIQDREGALFFASGVSNSSCVDGAEFNREINLLLDQPKDNCIFYFSSISIFYKTSQYTLHKKVMEELIMAHWENYNIIRLGNITWGDNPHTFINYLRKRKQAGLTPTFIDEYRYLINSATLSSACKYLPLDGKRVISLFDYMAKPKEII